MVLDRSPGTFLSSVSYNSDLVQFDENIAHRSAGTSEMVQDSLFLRNLFGLFRCDIDLLFASGPLSKIPNPFAVSFVDLRQFCQIDCRLHILSSDGP